jgi:hypothetical protein
MSCKDVRPGEEVLDAILADLDESRICRRIDEPIATVSQSVTQHLETFLIGKATPEVFSEFVRRVYTDGLHAPWKAADPEETTLMLLENYYRGLQSEGYYAAILDATGPVVGGMTFVLTQLAEIIRTKERQEYVEAVFTRHIDPSNWRLRCQIVEVLLERYRPLLPPELLGCAVWQLADDIPALVLAIVGSDAPMAGLAASRRKSPGD